MLRVDGQTLRRIVLFLTIFISFSHSLEAAEGKTLKIGFSPEKPPFVMATRPYTREDYDIHNRSTGILIDLVKAAFEGSPYRIKPVYASYKRIIANVEAGAIDGGEMGGGTRPTLYHSDVIHAFENFAITRKNDAIVLERIEDLEGLSVVAWQGASNELGDAYRKAVTASPFYHESTYPKGYCLMFFAQHVDVIVIADTIFQWWQSHLSSDYNTDIELVYHPLFPGTNPYTIGFHSKEVRDEFNRGLRRIREDGSYEKIVNRYLVPVKQRH